MHLISIVADPFILAIDTAEGQIHTTSGVAAVVLRPLVLVVTAIIINLPEAVTSMIRMDMAVSAKSIQENQAGEYTDLRPQHIASKWRLSRRMPGRSVPETRPLS